MRKKSLFRIRVFSASLLIVLCFFYVAHSQSSLSNLHHIKRIYIQAVPDIEEERKIEPFLKRELESRGFEIVADVSEADAVLSGEIQAEIVLHGDGSIPNKSIYLYRLLLPNKQIVWKEKVKFVSKASFAKDNEYAAKKIVEKLVKDWQKSAKKVGAD